MNQIIFFAKMEEKIPDSDKTKFADKGTMNASEFGRLIGCTVQAVKKMFGSKLTEGVSYLQEKNKILIDVEAARMQLRQSIKASTCRNEKLLEFLDLPKAGAEPPGGTGNEWVAELSASATREEMAKSELRLSLMQEEILSGKFVERKVVDKNLEAMGIEIRNSFLGIVARITSSIRAAPDERTAGNIANKEIEDVFDNLSKILEKDIAA